jgi:hypothetical protein
MAPRAPRPQAIASPPIIATLIIGHSGLRSKRSNEGRSLEFDGSDSPGMTELGAEPPCPSLCAGTKRWSPDVRCRRYGAFPSGTYGAGGGVSVPKIGPARYPQSTRRAHVARALLAQVSCVLEVVPSCVSMVATRPRRTMVTV